MGQSLGLNRNVNTVSVTTTYTVGADVDQVICNATSAPFTVTLTDFEDGAFHQVAFIIAAADSSGNNVTISGNAGSFSTSISSDGATSAIVQCQYDGTWFVAGDVSSVDAAAANSRAVSAGLQASTADSKAVSDSLLTSTAQSGVLSNSLNISTSGSQNTSQSLLISVADSKAVSDSVVISTLTTTADSKDTSQSLLISTADSKAESDSVVISSLTTTTNSQVASLSTNLSVTTSTANSA